MPPRRRKPRLSILGKLLIAFAVPTVALFALFAVVAHEVMRRDLDAELGTRLAAVASSAATQIRGKYLVELGADDEGDRAYQNTLRKLDAVAEATGVRFYLFDRGFESRADTDRSVPIGAKYFSAELDRHELQRVFADGASMASVLFEGTDGRMYKAGYAAVRASETEPEIVLALGAQAPAGYFARLAELRRILFLYGILLTVFVLLVSIAVAALLTRPVRQLAAAAARIGHGDLAAPIAVKPTRDEIGLLAETMEDMRRELGERDAHMQQMLSGIAHEVRNPLGGIELYTGILRDELPEGDERRGHVERIAREVGYLDRVVNEFLDYARRPPPELASIDLAAIGGDVVELLEPDAERAAVRLRSERDGDAAVLARADAGQVRRAVLNLVRNAVQAAASKDGGGGEVAVRAGRTPDDERHVTIEVWNDGPPIPVDAQDRIFDPFFTTREKGTGLGLAFVRQIVADHGGRIDLESTAAQGTRFRVTLPRAEGD